MNIMLVSVSERTREIGTRKALGAKRRDLLMQFIVESLALSTSGGAIGMILGVLIAKAVSDFGGWATSIEGPALAIAFTFSALVGLVAGVYPAMQAAKLDPVLALSHEGAFNIFIRYRIYIDQLNVQTSPTRAHLILG